MMIAEWIGTSGDNSVNRKIWWWLGEKKDMVMTELIKNMMVYKWIAKNMLLTEWIETFGASWVNRKV